MRPSAVALPRSGYAAAMEPLRKEIGRSGIADRDAGSLGHGIAFGDESCRQVRSRAALDFRDCDRTTKCPMPCCRPRRRHRRPAP